MLAIFSILRRLPIGLELTGVHHGDVGRHLEHAAATQFTQLIDEPCVVLRAPFERGK